ncbi:MAG: lipoate--protein ligase [Chloroflexi bacterium]|nr:lipoate--protein ligase [Chloroflexota bacterium]
MLFVNNQNRTDPRWNLALEEHLLRNVQSERPLLLFYINEPAVIIGRNQNSIQEIDPDFIKQNDIHVVRRLSGGGAVYHDLGNLNFSFITNGRENLHNFALFTEPVIRALNKLGVEAECRGRSDIFANNKKISGNAQYATAQRMFSHGTLLFDSNLETLLKALNPRQAEISSKAVQSIRNFVTNIRELLPVEMEIHQFRETLLKELFDDGAVSTYPLTAVDWDKIAEIAATRYQTWEWNIGRAPQFNAQKHGRYEGVGTIEVRIDVVHGRIQQIKFYGDFAGLKPVSILEQQLIGLRYDKDSLSEALQNENLTSYFGNLSFTDFIELLS